MALADALRQLATLSPGIVAGLKGDGNAMKAFMESYQQTSAQLDEQERQKQAMGMQAEDRQRMITRQGEQDKIAAEDRDYRRSQDALQMLSQIVPQSETLEGAESMSQGVLSGLPPSVRERVAGMADAQLRQMPSVFSARRVNEFKKWVGGLGDSEFVAQMRAEGANADISQHLQAKAPRMLEIMQQQRPGKTSFSLDDVYEVAEMLKPAEKKETSAPFSLGPGQTRFDGSGQPIATVPPKPEKAGDGTPEQVFVVRDGKVIPIAKGTAQPGDVPYSARNQNDTRPVTAGDTADIADINEALQLASGLTFEPSDTGILPALGAGAPDAVTNLTGFGVGAKQRQGMINLVRQIIGKGLEGGVLRKEDEAKYAKMLPTISDHPDVVKSKIKTLISTLEQKRTVRLDAMRDAGYDVSKFDARAGGGTVEYVRGADGKLVRK